VEHDEPPTAEAAAAVGAEASALLPCYVDAIATTATTATTTIYDPDNVDCVEEQDPCTAACQSATNRNYAVSTVPVKNGKACTGPSECQPGEGGCPPRNTTTNATVGADASTRGSSAGRTFGWVLLVLLIIAAVAYVVIKHDVRVSKQCNESSFWKKKQDQALPTVSKCRY
jgi:hypothetical protein